LIKMDIEDLNIVSSKTTKNIKSISFNFDGPVGNIEAILDIPETQHQSDYYSVICHPHPLHGGSMTNKVAHYIAKSLNELNHPTLRFNFRGVGKSQGLFDNAEGEKKDLLAAIDLMQNLYPEKSLCLSGFSFGAYIALSMAHFVNADKLITVAPAVHLYDFTKVELPDCDWLLIQGNQDEIVPSDQAITWAQSLTLPPTIEILENTGHFFHGRLNDLRNIIINHLQTT